METTASNLNAFFSAINKTISCLGEKNFYRKLTLINGNEIANDIIDCHTISEQIFLFLSKNNVKDCHLKLIELQNTDTKISEKEYSMLLDIIALKFEVDKERILEGRTVKKPVQNARNLFFFLLKNHFDITVKQILKTHFFSNAYIDMCIRKHDQLSPKIPEHQILIQIRNEIIHYLKTQ